MVLQLLCMSELGSQLLSITCLARTDQYGYRPLRARVNRLDVLQSSSSWCTAAAITQYCQGSGRSIVDIDELTAIAIPNLVKLLRIFTHPRNRL